MPQNIGDNRISADGIARIRIEDAERLSKYRVKQGDIVYSRRGDVERRALVREREDGWLCGTGCLRVRLGKGPVDPVFAAFYLGTAEAREWIVRHAHGATMPNLNTSILSACPISFPPLPEQRAISSILVALDDKIDLNLRMNETLEAMARVLFKDWFVDFGPTRAKMEGREPYLAPDLWTLFPDRLDEDGKPEGWETVPLDRLIEFNPKEALRKGLHAPYLDMAALPTVSANPDLPVPREYTSGMRFRNGDALFARITPCLENGKTCFVQCLADDAVGWGSTEFIVMRSRPPIPAPVSYLMARDQAFRTHAIQSMTGTSGRQRARVEALEAFPICAPDQPDLWKALGVAVTPMFEKIEANGRESRTLAQTRDLLLPKLMSGEIKVGELADNVGADA